MARHFMDIDLSDPYKKPEETIRFYYKLNYYMDLADDVLNLATKLINFDYSRIDKYRSVKEYVKNGRFILHYEPDTHLIRRIKAALKINEFLIKALKHETLLNADHDKTICKLHSLLDCGITGEDKQKIKAVIYKVNLRNRDKTMNIKDRILILKAVIKRINIYVKG